MPSVADGAVDGAALLAALPPPADIDDAAGTIAAHAREHGTKVVVIDDDPTGTQAVADVPVVTSTDEDDLRWALAQDAPCIFVETDSRAMPEEDASRLNRSLARRLARLALESGFALRLVSRSDSTLRGHFPAEPEALSQGLCDGGLSHPELTVVCPAFFSAGRITVDDVHYVADGDAYVPVALTEFARDATFGYTQSNLRAWIRERAGATTPVAGVSIDDIRIGGPARVEERLRELDAGTQVVVNAAHASDLDVFVLGLLAAEDSGRRVLLRTAPSLAGQRAANAPRLASAAQLADRRSGHGLIAVGSHTRLTTRQLRAMTDRHRLTIVEIGARDLAAPATSARAIDAALHDLEAALRHGDAGLVTSRELVLGDTPQASLALSRRVAGGVAEVVRRLDESDRLGWVIAKGGITSSEVARQGLGARRAFVIGQMLPGLVPVWRLEREGRAPLPYVVFPGNVGATTSLADTVDRLNAAA